MTKQTEEPTPLTSKQKKYLKGLAHPLSPVIQIGKEGIGQGVIEATLHELGLRELIKVKIGKNSGTHKNTGGEELAARTGSQLVQVIGKTLVLYKANPDRDKEERIRLPKG